MSAPLVEFAQSCHGWGANVTAIRPNSKAPAHEWKQWKHTRQTVTQLKALPWRAADAMGFINGINGWRSFDIDARKVAGQRVPVAESVTVALLGELGLPPDYQWSSRSKSGAGWHVVIRCNEALPPEWGDGVIHGDPANGYDFKQLELRWSDGQTILSGRWKHQPFVAPALVTAEAVVNAFLAVAKLRSKGQTNRAGRRASGKREHGGGKRAEIRQRFDLVAYARMQFGGDEHAEGNGEVRILGNGGLLIKPDDGIWNCFADGLDGTRFAGDCFDLVGYAAYGEAYFNDKRRYWPDVLRKAAEFAGVTLPEQETGGDSAEGKSGRGFDLRDYRAEDGGILDLWLDYRRDLWAFVTGLEQWYWWNGTHWEPDAVRKMQREIIKTLDLANHQARELRALAADDAAVKLAGAWVAATRRSRSRVASIEGMAQAVLARASDGLDAGNVLNLANGTLDLDTLTLRAHDRADYQTYCLPYAFDAAADCPRWRRFVAEVLVDADTGAADAELGLLLQELMGYSLTTDTRHEVMVWLAGEGSNGKSVLLGVLRSLVGELATTVNFHTLGQSGNYDLSTLPGKRVVWSSESIRGGTVAENTLKTIVSGEPLTARPIYGKPMTFTSVAKVWWAMNDKPSVRDTSNAIWRRLRLIPFNRAFGEQERDPTLAAQLAAETPGILNWALEGLRRLRVNGVFTDAAAARLAVDELRKESNPIDQWREERTVPTEAAETKASELYADYEQWAKASGYHALNRTNFGREVKRLPGVVTRTSGWVFYNLELVDDDWG